MRIPARFFVLGGFLFLLLVFPFGGYSQTFSSGQPVLHTFQIDSSQFLLDGKPFEIIAGEMHYARIPARYWKQRIEMAKAMGCNAISTYVFWNYHEQQPGHFDFKTGNRDLAHFIQLVQDAGMWLLIRPGPYVCAEWDFGGLPPYLLRYPEIKLRCSDTNYMQAVARYIQHLAAVIKPYQITHGGPVVLLQIENEYGSYGNDRSYLKTLEKLWRKNGINIPFYTADGGTPYMLEAGSLPGCAVGLDPGGYEKAIRLAQKINPGVPVFSSETYTGWLTHWREKWAKADTADLYKEVRFLLQHHRSLSFYVVHGGTNFGFTAGANASGQRFQPDVTSYDYAAPITETGRPTAEFFRLRQLIHQYHPETKLLPVPAAPPLISIPEVEMKVFSSVWANLPKPVHSVQPRPFEYYGQYHGYMMYQTRLIGRKSGKLVLTQLHDYATVFLNGKYIGSIDRTKGQNSIVLPKTKARVPLLQILTEAMGHVNYGSQLIDRKGITERATLNGMILMNWEVYGLPLGVSYLKHLIPDHDVSRPGVFFRGTFQLDKTGDTYFDLSRYQKGLVWVNGHLLGRYWNVGPQHSLYCPASFLKKGRNEILIFDLHQIHPMPVKGIRKLL